MPIRVQLSRRKGWRMPENTVSVARPTRWGNPYAVGQPFRKAGASTFYVTDNAMAATLFRRAATGKLSADVMYNDPQAWGLYVDRAKRELRGKNLACWCALDEPCHADVLLEIANG
jgi:hypothetical protein